MNGQKNSQPETQGDGQGMVCTCCSHYNGQCGCGCCGHGWYGHHWGHRLLRVVIALAVALLIFGFGVKIGEIKSWIEGNGGYGGYGGWYMPHAYMMGGYGGYYGGYGAPTGGLVPQNVSGTPTQVPTGR